MPIVRWPTFFLVKEGGFIYPSKSEPWSLEKNHQENELFLLNCKSADFSVNENM